MVLLAFFLSTLVRQLDKAIQIAFIVILGNVLIMIAFINAPGTIDLFYREKMRTFTYIKVATHILEYFSVFNFCIGFGLICMYATDRFDARSMNWRPGDYYGDEMFHKSTIRISMQGPKVY